MDTRRLRFSLLHPLWPAIALLAGLILVLSMTSAQALPEEPKSPSAPDVPGGIEGTLLPPLGTAQVPVEGGWIDIFDEFGEPWMGTDTDPAGHFEIANLPPGNYFVIGFPPPNIPFAASDVIPVEVLSGQWVSQPVHLTWPKVSGWVQDCDTADRIPGMPVMVHTVDWTVERWAETDLNGEFKIGGTALISGATYIAEAVPPPESGYVPVIPPIEVVPITTNVVLEVCIPPTNVVGTVLDYLGAPVPDAGVVVIRDDEEHWDETAADDMGDFVFRGLPPGVYWVVASPPWGQLGEGLISSPPFTIHITAPDTFIDVGVITLPKALKTVVGQVVNLENGAPITDAVAVAHRLDRPGFSDQIVDPSGTFTMGLPGGEWELVPKPLPQPPFFEPVEWVFPGPTAWVAFEGPISETEVLTVELGVIPTDAWIEGRVVCPGGGLCGLFPGAPPPEEIWVELRNEHFEIGTELKALYHFNLPVPAGWYELVVHVHHPALQGPEPFPVFVGPGQALDVGDIELVGKDAQIVGQVRNQQGNVEPGVPVVGWRSEGFGWGWAETDANGVYTMPVIHGEWFVEPHPHPWSDLVYRERPRQVRVAPGGTQVVNFRVIKTDARILGIAVDKNAPMPERLWGLDGWATAWIVPHDVLFSDAPMFDGGFELKVKGNYTYVVGLHLPPHAPFVSGGAYVGPVAPGEVATAVVPLEHKDAGIEGQLINALTSNPAVGAKGEVFGEDMRGNWAVTRVDPDTAGYGMEVVSGTWRLRAWVDPASGYVAPPTVTVVVAPSGPPTVQDFEVFPIRSTISGQAFQPDGSPLEGAFVFAEGESPFVGYFEAFTKTNAAGEFALPVLDGVYFVGAGLPRHRLEANEWLNPPPIADVRTSVFTPATGLEFHFRQLDGLITGTVAFAGAGVTPTHPAFVWGWAESGGWAEVEAEPIEGTREFAYEMKVISGTVWHIGAVYDDWDAGMYYESPEKKVDLRSTDQAQQDLLLGAPQPMPRPFIVSFDGSQMQTIVMPDGVRLEIPPSSLVVSGTVTLFIFPTKEMRPEEGKEIIGVGYEIWAVDENGQEITQFNQNVQMTFSYPSDAVLQAQGVNENLLIPVYYSTLAGRWVLADSYVVDTVNNKIQLQLSHFSKFGTLSTEPGQEFIYLPVVLKDAS